MITESIWSNKKVTIPMAEVSHIVKEDFGLWVVFKHSKTNQTSKLTMKLEPAIWLESGKGFEKDWCRYRAELECLI